MLTKKERIALIAVFSLLVFGILGFIYLFITAHDYAISLGNGYRYYGAKEGLTVIDRGYMSDAESECVHELWNENIRKNIDYDIEDIGAPRVGPNVDSYRVYSRIITGHVSEPQVDYGIPTQQSRKIMKQGYFIIDKRIHKIYRGLSKQEWRTQLRKYGLNHEPRLFIPTGSPWKEYKTQ